MRVVGLVVVSSVLSACAASSGPSSPRGEAATSPPETAPSAASAPRRSGRLAPEVIQKVIRQAFGRFRSCYERDLARNPEAAGRAMSRFVIGRDGRIEGTVTTTMDGSLGPDVAPCLEAVFASLVFPAPEGGVVTVTYPIIFSPAPPPDATP